MATGVVLVASVVLRFVSHSPLWLDEAQSVAIAHRSVPHLFTALRHDGSPPLYYLLLHVWMKAFGTSTFSVRALSGACSVAALPVMAAVAGRFGFMAGARWPAVLVLATNPFAIRYATETRMYSLVVLLVLIAMLVFERIWSQGGWSDGGWRWSVAAVVVTAALVLTQYWTLFLVIVAGAAAIIAWWRGERRGRRLLVPMVIGSLAFVPWLPSFAYQSAHTGAPWGGPPGLDVPFLIVFGWAGAGAAAPLLALGYYVLIALALAGASGATGGITFSWPPRRPPTMLLGLAFATLAVGTLVSDAVSSAYADRYSIVSLAPALLVIAAGLGRLSVRQRTGALVVVCVFGLYSGAIVGTSLRTQAGQVASALAAAGPQDLVVICPDQLGPAVSREAPHDGRQVVFPTFGSPAMVDWVDYASRNKRADPVVFAQQALRLAAGHPIWLVYADGYRTFHNDCLKIYTQLTAVRGAPVLEVRPTSRSFERDSVARFR